MGQPLAMVLRGAGPRPPLSRRRFSALTTLMRRRPDFADRMLPSRLRNWLFPPLLPTTETTPLTEEKTTRQRPPTSTTASWVITVLAALVVLALGLFLVFMLVYKRAASLMKMMCTCADESDELNNKQVKTKPVEKTNRRRQSGKCVLPAYPENGSYVITNASDATPGDRFESAVLTVICLPDFRVLGNKEVLCVDGRWSAPIPKCIRFCKLPKHASVRYKCRVSGAIKGTRKCNLYEPSGTEVRPKCKRPNYYSAVPLPFMRCIDGSWNYVAVCSPECGRVTPNGEGLMIGGRSAKHGELPWHVGIYSMNTRPYKQICGGTIVSNRLVISAAHCFWNDKTKLQPASQYAVAAGKIYRPWNNNRDTHAQKSFVAEIKIPARFRGNEANFQDDIALLFLKTPLEYNPFVRPACLDFNADFDVRQLQPGKMGKVAGWGLTAENGNPSQVLKVVDLPYVDITECYAASPPGFTEYITSDKICAGFGNGTALCRGDSGGGLAFPEFDRGTERYYLRGIVSTAPNNENLCNSHTLTTFTQILIHEHFVMKYLALESG